jgi:hypothetical protein
MGETREILLGFTLAAILIPAGCSAGSTPATITPFSTNSPRTPPPTYTSTATFTATPTATEVPTVFPFVTPSPGPKPELELTNIMIENSWGENFYFMAEIVNNSNDVIILNDREEVIKITVESWWDWGGYYHGFADYFIQPISGTTNCILFPGETGIIGFGSMAHEPFGSTDPERTYEIPGPLEYQGTRLYEYQAFFRRWKDLKLEYPFNQSYYDYPEVLVNDYHPKAENLTFRIDGAMILFDYDVRIVLPPYGSPDDTAWLILFDKNDNIINIFYTHDPFCIGGRYCMQFEKYHVHGVGSNSRVSANKDKPTEVQNQWWKPLIETTEARLQRVDHIQVLNEIRNSSMCSIPLAYAYTKTARPD